jgi:ATP-dependent helicase HrpA
LKSLPKSIRQRLPSPAHTAKLLLEQKSYSNKSLPQALSQLLQDKYKVTVPRDTWALDKLPTHLNIRYSVIDEKGDEIKNSRDINLLQKELANTANTSAMDNLRRDWEKEGITRWDFGELPQHIPLTGISGLIGYAYPALHVVDGLVNLRLFSDQKESIANHLQGVAALYTIHFADKLKQLKKNVTLNAAMKATAAKIGNPKHLEQSMINRVKKDLFFKLWRKQEDFIQHANTLNSKILPYGQQVFDSIAPVLNAFAETHTFVHKLIMKNTGNSPVLKFLKNIQAELGSLVPNDFPEYYTFDRMNDLPRYCKALALRAERGSLNLSSAQKKMQEVKIYSAQLLALLTPSKTSVIPAKAGIQESGNVFYTIPDHIKNMNILFDYSEEKKKLIEELFWIIEEYKVSLFAQELKTPYPVSPKKLNQLIKEIESTI